LTSEQYAFLENLSKNPANIVIGLARSKAPLEAKLQRAGITNVHIVQGDVNDRISLKVWFHNHSAKHCDIEIC
jgi:NADP-dependent 3-hydroxy acid dehydrogenase YdfG